MHRISAKTENQERNRKSVVFVIYPEIALLDLAGPLQVFGWAKRPGIDMLAYQLFIVSKDGGMVQSDTILTVESGCLDDWLEKEIDTLIIIGGDGVYPTLNDQEFVERVTSLAKSAVRVCSVCSGALLLAATGLLDQRRAVTHWQDTDALIDRFPNVSVERDPLYIKDGHIWTSAGVTSGLDMSLAIVAEDLGHEAALERAQALVAYMARPGGQSQFSPVLERQRRDRSGRFDELHRWISANLGKGLGVQDLAEKEHMSLRNFHRAYTTTMGITPAKAIKNMKLEAARDLLESSSDSIKRIASRCGFGSEGQMREAFRQSLGVSPSDYRSRFSG